MPPRCVPLLLVAALVPTDAVKEWVVKDPMGDTYGSLPECTGEPPKVPREPTSKDPKGDVPEMPKVKAEYTSVDPTRCTPRPWPSSAASGLENVKVLRKLDIASNVGKHE
eukprot:gene9805-8731_t